MAGDPQAACPFCDWAAGTPFVHEDPLAVALIDRRPINRYHVLVVPRRHVVNFVDLPPELLTHLFRLTQVLSQGIRDVCRPDAIQHLTDDDLAGHGFNLVPHFKIHIIPRFQGDRVRIDWGRGPEPSLADRGQWAAELRAALAGEGGAAGPGAPLRSR
jgi:histidine triad (HIT) family protein